MPQYPTQSPTDTPLITRSAFVLTVNGEYSDLSYGFRGKSQPFRLPTKCSDIMKRFYMNYGDEFAEELHLYSNLNLFLVSSSVEIIKKIPLTFVKQYLFYHLYQLLSTLCSSQSFSHSFIAASNSISISSCSF